MTQPEHKAFIASVVKQYGLSLELKSGNQNGFAEQVCHCLSTDTEGMRLLGMSMASMFLEHEIGTSDFESLIRFASCISRTIVNTQPACSYELLQTGIQTRRFLFWCYLSAGNSEPRLIRASAALLNACIAADPEWLSAAEFALTQVPAEIGVAFRR